jgi:membrane-bound serine protease (ClpP class)
MSQTNWWFTGILIFVAIGLISLVIALIVRTYRHRATTGKEDLKGRVAIVKETLNPQGVVFVEGEFWNAVSQSGIIEVDQEVVISEVKGLTLSVNNKTKE